MIDNEVYAIRSDYVQYRTMAPERLTATQLLREQDGEATYNLFAKTASEKGDGYYQMPVSIAWVHPTLHGISIDVGAKNSDLITVSRGTGLMDKQDFWVSNPEMPLRITVRDIGFVVVRGYFMTYRDGILDS